MKPSMHNLLLLGLIALCSMSGMAQESTTSEVPKHINQNIRKYFDIDLDSMRYWLDKRNAITQREAKSSEHAKTLKSYGDYYIRVGQPDSAFRSFENSQNILLEVGDSVFYARNAIGVGQAYAKLGNKEQALATFQKGLNLFQELGDSLGIAIINDNLGTNLTHWGKHNEALAYMLEANSYYRHLGRANFEGNSFNTLALIYRHTGNTEKELECYRKAYAILEKLEEPIRLGLVCSNWGSSLFKVDSLKQGLTLLKKAEQLFEETGYANGLLSVYNGYIAYYTKEQIKDYAEVEFYAKKCMNLAEQQKSYKDYVDAAYNLGKNYLAQKKEIDAILTFKKSYEMAAQFDFLRKESGSAHELAKLYEKQGNNYEAVKYYKVYMTIKDSLLNEEQIEEFKEIELNHAFAQERLADSLQSIQERQALELAHQEALLEEQQSKNLLIFGLVVFLLIAAFSIWAFNRKKQQTKLLEEKNGIIEEALHEKQLLLKEVHHRVKNNFQVLSSLLELQSKDIEDEKAQQLALEGKNRVKSMALIHQRLYQNDDLLIHFNEYIEKLVSEIALMYGGENERKVEVNVPDYTFDIDTAIPLGLIVNELVTNAYKYGVDEGNEENILSISVKEESKGNYKLEVKDNGKGMASDFDWKKSKSLGLRLVKRLSKQLQGSAEYAYQQGALFTVIFKDSISRAEID